MSRTCRRESDHSWVKQMNVVDIQTEELQNEVDRICIYEKPTEMIYVLMYKQIEGTEWKAERNNRENDEADKGNISRSVNRKI